MIMISLLGIFREHQSFGAKACLKLYANLWASPSHFLETMADLVLWDVFNTKSGYLPNNNENMNNHSLIHDLIFLFYCTWFLCLWYGLFSCLQLLIQIDFVMLLLIPHKHSSEIDEDDENSYEVLRKAVKEYWIMMKEYYQAVRYSFYIFSLSYALGKCTRYNCVEYL